MRFFMLCLVLALSACAGSRTSAHDVARMPAVHAVAPVLLEIPLEREGVVCPVWWMPHDAARATLVLFTGGTGALGSNDNDAQNDPRRRRASFLIGRSRDLFHRAGFNIAMVGRPRDRKDLTREYRTSAEHGRDIRDILLYLKKMAPEELWLVGTSNGTVSAANAAIVNSDIVDGLVLTSGITSPMTPYNVPRLDLWKIRAPTFVLHHSKDACQSCPPGSAGDILAGLSNAPDKELVFLSGGSDARGRVCGPLHYHGFINEEEEAVTRIVSWIRARLRTGSSS